MKIAFHTNQLSLRGTEVSMYNYAKYSEELLGHESIVLSKDPSVWKYSDPQAIERFQARFPVHFYKDITDIEKILDQNHVDIFYAQKAGLNDGVFSKKRKSVVHVVFQHYEPHGDVYAFISEWLARVYNNRSPFVPYMVDLPNYYGDLREELGIPKDAIVFGRHGGVETFNLDFVKERVIRIAKSDPKTYFLFLNTDVFSDASIKNIIYLPSTADLIRKTAFINTCNAMLHARQQGETFGLACAEFSLRNKPVITYGHGYDKEHIRILDNMAFTYNSPLDLDIIMGKREQYFSTLGSPKFNRYADYTPEKVMEKFKKVFLD